MRSIDPVNLRYLSKYALALFLVVAIKPEPRVIAKSFFKGGVAEETLQVPSGTILGGYGVYLPPVTNPPRRSTGTLDPLKVSAFALKGLRSQVIVILGVDAIGLRFSTVKKIQNAITKWDPFVSVIVNASHSHSTPDTFGLWGPLTKSGVDQEYLKHLEDKSIETVKKAVSSLKPVNIAWGQEIFATEVVGKTYPTKLTVFYMEEADTNKLIGTLTHWSAHPTILPPKNTLVSADYVGFYRAHLKHFFKEDVIHTFATGILAGNYAIVSSKLPSPFEIPDFDTLHPDVKLGIGHSSHLGHALAERTHVISKNTRTIVDSSVLAEPYTAWMSVTNGLFRWAMRLGVIENLAPRGRFLAPLRWFKIGPFQGVAIPGEPTPLVAQAYIRKMSQQGVKHHLVFGQSGGMVGYILDQENEYDHEDWSYQRTVSPSEEAANQLYQRFLEVYWWSTKREKEYNAKPKAIPLPNRGFTR